ncbi:hypothetical protein [Hyalangium gracile]|uniref:hypothetical protein n=1 Tax=Hyalangium gracile TaxID=394092 RepID=UPI001CCC3B62|nr:hypothetical protein [Hyalangium gracile]
MKESEGTHAELVPGVLVGPWRIRARHDRGSFGVVFRAQRAGHSEAGPFALKVAVTAEDPRYKREVALLQSLQHASVPRFEAAAAATERASRPGPPRRRAPWLPAGAALATVALLVGGALAVRGRTVPASNVFEVERAQASSPETPVRRMLGRAY